ncbi:hypothetical protein GIX10_00390 [Acinetobacter sp. YIM 103518]|uniref:Uncharacterized protein n=1 Tax=Acinetobacter faecalis TaxID=2665161 RepID=A0A6L6GDE8_9GAMM|nr:hypothetical protein [Acinetobacter faecalis]MTD09914.1 hypothetical protein [Acinetobacter faecalis]
MNIIYMIIAFVVISLIQFGCYSNVKDQRDTIESKTVAKYEKQIAEDKEAQRIALEKVNEELFIVSNELEAEKQNIKIEFRDIRHETQKIITDRIYTECKLTNDGLRILNRAIETANTSKPDD